MIFQVVSLSVFFIVFFCGQCVFTEKVPSLTVPSDITIECNTTSPNITGYATASSNCNASVVVSYVDVVVPGSVYTLLRTWTAMDSCGNTSASQTIQVFDDIAPSISLPSIFLTWCNYTEGTLGENITDNCDTLKDLHINHTNTPSMPNLACPEDFTFSQIWTVVDQSGFEGVASTTIAVQVVTDITWGYLPSPIKVECTSGVYPNITGMAIAFDQCYRLVPVTWQDSVYSHYCNTTTYYQFQRNFFSMRCGVQKSYVQNIEVIPGEFPPEEEPPTMVPTGETSPNGTTTNQIPPEPNSTPITPETPETPVTPVTPEPNSGPICSCPNGFCFGGTECITCKTGYFGSNCVQICFCQNGLCDDGLDGNGYCVVCKQGYYGAACDNQCSCTNGVCNDGTDGDGTCLSCKKGSFGVNCQMDCLCNDGICDDGPTGTGVCLNSLYVTQSPTPNTLAPFLVGVVILLIFLFIFFLGLAIGLFLYYRFKTEKHLYGISYRKNEKQPLVEPEK